METTEHTRLGALLLEGNLIREDELERCLELQALTGGTRPLGQILIEQDVITRDELAELLDLQQRRAKVPAERIPVAANGVDRFLSAAAKVGATEVILTEGEPVMLRISGCLRPVDDQPLQSPEMWQFLMDHMGSGVLDELADTRYVSREFHRAGIGRGRINAFRHFDGACAVVRLHPESVRPLSELELPPTLQSCLQARKGLILLTGPMGSGITSTMGTLLAEIVRGDPKLVIFLDESEEIHVPHADADLVIRRVGRDTTDYQSGLEAAILEKPDVIAVADVSTPRSFDLALRAAEGGCLVIAALNARDIQSALLRALEFYPPHDVQRIRNTLASVLNCVLRLQLVPETQGRGHVLASELLILDGASRTVLRDGEIGRLGLLMAMENGSKGHSLDTSLERLYREGRICLDDGFGFADDRARFLKRTRSIAHEGVKS